MFKVIQVEKIDDDDSWGEVSLNKMTIRIKKSLTDTAKRDSFIHEVMHVVFRYAGFKADSFNEGKVEAVSMMLSDVLAQAELK